MSAISTKQPETKRIWGKDFCAKRTEAMPKHSLFGCELEITSDNPATPFDLNGYKERERQTRLAKSKRYKTELPDYLKKKCSDKPLAETKQKLDKQITDTNRARDMLDLLEEKSKYFTVGTIVKKQPRRTSSGQTHPKMSVSQFEENDNIFPPVYNYSLIGDPMALGMEFQDRDGDTSTKVSMKRKPFIPPQQLSKEYFMEQYASQKPTVDTSSWAVQLPANIQHQFGTKVCSAVLTDKQKVDQTITNQKRLRESFLKIKPKMPLSKAMSPIDTDPLYDSLGQALRQDIFPGHTFGHKKSFQRSVYTDDVFKQRVSDPDEFRYQRDELSTWAEQNVLRERVKKAWDVYLAETLQNKAK